MKNATPLSLEIVEKADLPDEQKKFIQAYIQTGFDPVSAFRSAIQPNAPKELAEKEATLILEREKVKIILRRVRSSLEIIAESVGLNDRAVFLKIAQMLDAKIQVKTKLGQVIGEMEDFKTVKDGIELWAKLLGKFSPEKKIIKIDDDDTPKENFDGMSVEQLEIEKERILAEMRY